MKTLLFSYRKAVLWALVFTAIGAVGIALATHENRITSVLTFSVLFPVVTITVCRALSPVMIQYSKDEVIFRQIITGDCRTRWDDLERIDYRRGNQHVFRFGLVSLYILPFCYENSSWQDFTQHIRIKK